MAYTHYYRDITIQNNEASDLTDYQVCIEISDIDFFIKADPNNLVIVDGDTILPYWVETWKRPDGVARIWTKVNLPASGSKTIELCYGGFISWIQQDGDSVFEFFDDFDEPDLDSSKWSVVGSYELVNSCVILHLGSSSGGISTVQTFGKGYRFVVHNQATDQDVNLLKLRYVDGASYTDSTAYELGNSDADREDRDYLRLRSFVNGNAYDVHCYNQDSILHTLKTYRIDRYPDGTAKAYQNYRYIGQFSKIIEGNLRAQVVTWNSDASRNVYIGYFFIAKLVQNEPTITISSETEETRYWLQSPTGTLTGQVCDKNGNIITGTSVDVIVLNKDTKEVENVTASNVADGSWQVEVSSGKKLTVFALEGNYGEDIDIAGAEFLEVE